MDKIEDLPFKVGQVAEARSFLPGYRGAWFRCKIKQFSKRSGGHIWLDLEYFDFPDEKIKWTKLYQMVPSYAGNRGKSKDTKKHLMVRPRYPILYNKNDLPRITNPISEVTVITDGVFKIGDFVDWWKDDCYWSGKVTKTLPGDMLEIELPPPPSGEGSSYEVSPKDLRPSLDWFPECGWKVPCSTGSEKGRTCARLIQPVSQAAEGLVSKNHSIDKGTNDFHATARSSFTPSVSSHNLSTNCKRKENPKQSLSTTVSVETAPVPDPNMDLHTGDCVTGKMVMLDSVSSSHVTGAETAQITAAEEDRDSSRSLKRLRDKDDNVIPLNSMRSDSIEAALFDLEEVANKVKWLKSILEFGLPLPNDVKPAWKFVEHRPS